MPVSFRSFTGILKIKKHLSLEPQVPLNAGEKFFTKNKNLHVSKLWREILYERLLKITLSRTTHVWCMCVSLSSRCKNVRLSHDTESFPAFRHCCTGSIEAHEEHVHVSACMNSSSSNRSSKQIQYSRLSLGGEGCKVPRLKCIHYL